MTVFGDKVFTEVARCTLAQVTDVLKREEIRTDMEGRPSGLALAGDNFEASYKKKLVLLTP